MEREHKDFQNIIPVIRISVSTKMKLSIKTLDESVKLHIEYFSHLQYVKILVLIFHPTSFT